MTYITKLHLHGFKSFAKPTTLDLNQGYNCIIGANGSGKTNIADAVVFVLGSLSAKTMRAEKAASLIFNGGKKGAPMSHAEVSIFFSNESREFPLDHKEIKVSRIIKDNGNSVYRINDETVTRQQVLDLMSHAKIDPDGHNIVLQGDIVRFAEMKPEERREIIENIAGISVYEDKKKQALSELNKVDAKLNEAEIILTERKTYLRELKKDRDHALKYRELEKNIKSNKATILHKDIKDRESKRDEVNSRLASYSKEIEKINSKVKELKTKTDNLKVEVEDLNKDIEQKGEVEALKLQKEIEGLKTESARKSERLSTCTNEIEKINTRIRQLNESLKETENTISGLENAKKDIENRIISLEKKENKLNSDIKDFKEKHHLMDSTELEKVEKQFESLQADVHKLNDDYNETLQKKYHLEAQLKHLGEQIEEAEKLEAASEIKKISDSAKKLSSDLEKEKTNNSSALSQLSRARHAINEYNTELFRLQARHASRQEFVAADMAIKKILGMNKPGVFGLVTDLVKVKPEYSLAMEIAAGSRIKSIIVDSDKTAADCIKVLKETKMGTCIFVPLNKIRPNPPAGSSEEGVIGNALGLVEYDQKFKIALSYIFGSTLIVKDVETARRIGVGKHRMVTIEGDLFEVSGAIIGGYRRARQASFFRETDADKRMEELEEKIEHNKKLIDLLEKKIIESDNTIDELREKKNNFEAELAKLEKTSSILNLKELKKESEKLRKEKTFDEAEKLEDELEEKRKELENIRILRDKTRSGTKDLRNPEIAASLSKLDESRSKTREETVQSRTELKNIELQLSNIYIPEKSKTHQIIRQHIKELEDFMLEKATLERYLRDSASVLKQKEAQEEKFQKDYKNLFVKRSRLSEETTKREVAISSEEEKIREIESKVNNANISRAKIIAELESLQKEYEPYQGTSLRHSISEDELKSEIKKFEKLMIEMGNVNLRALEIYESIEKEYEELLNKAERLKQEKEAVLSMMQEIDSKKKGRFMKTFREITSNFENIFLSLSTKGQAFLELENKENPFEGGVDVKLKMAGNKYLDIRAMSGGEKTLTALAFIFAIQEFEPAPFYFLDEVDAALDKTNSELLSKLVSKYSQDAQYLLISHNDAIVTDASIIYGVTMQENAVSKVVSLKLP